MLRTVQSLPLAGLSTLGFDPARFQTEPPVCYRASWQLPGPDFHRLATTSTNTKITSSRHEAPPVLLGARKIRVNEVFSPAIHTQLKGAVDAAGQACSESSGTWSAAPRGRLPPGGPRCSAGTWL